MRTLNQAEREESDEPEPAPVWLKISYLHSPCVVTCHQQLPVWTEPDHPDRDGGRAHLHHLLAGPELDHLHPARHPGHGGQRLPVPLSHVQAGGVAGAAADAQQVPGGQPWPTRILSN